jgi:hypothetical protein
MKAQVRHVLGPDGLDLATYRSTDPDHFCVGVRLIAGPAGASGEESFDFEVCTASALEEKLGGDPRLLRHVVLIRRFDPDAIIRFVEAHVRSCEGDTWPVLAEKLGRLGHWEFEDYQPFSG